MSITNYKTISSGAVTIVNVTSTLTGQVFYFWYLDGRYVSVTQSPSYTFAIAPGTQATVTCIDSNSSTLPASPVGWPSTRTLLFVRSADPTIDRYRIEQQNGGQSGFSSGFSSGFGAPWQVLGFVADDPSRWDYQFSTIALADLTSYAWRVIPVDAAGNDGAAVALLQEMIVRTPDAPDFAVALSADKVVFSQGT